MKTTIKEIYNLEYLESVKVFDKRICPFVKWKDGFKSFLFGEMKSGFYSRDGGYYLGQSEDLLNGAYYIMDISTGEKTHFILITEDKKAYYRPYVKLTFISGDNHYEYFETIEECHSYSSKLYNDYIKKRLIF